MGESGGTQKPPQGKDGGQGGPGPAEQLGHGTGVLPVVSDSGNGHAAAPMTPAERDALVAIVHAAAPGLGLAAFDDVFEHGRAEREVVSWLEDGNHKPKHDYLDFYLRQAATEVKGKLYTEAVARTLARLPNLCTADELRRYARPIADAMIAGGIRVNDPAFDSHVYTTLVSIQGGRTLEAKVAQVLGRAIDDEVRDVAAILERRGVTAEDPLLAHYVGSLKWDQQGQPRGRVRDVLALAGYGTDHLDVAHLTLPPLEAMAEMQIYPENIRSLGLAYFVMQFEELQIFRVVDWLAREFMLGRLPLGFGEGGRRLYQYLKRRDQRLQEVDRLGFYHRSFGVGPATGGELQPNHHFPQLWMNLLIATTEYIASQRVGELILRAGDRTDFSRTSNRERVLRAVRDLQTNLSQIGFGAVPWFAREMAASLQDAFDLLSDREILAALGVPDAWSAINRISASFLGGAGDTYQKKTMAEQGRAIFDFMADHHRDVYVVGDRELERLVSAVEKWLSVNLAPEDRALTPAVHRETRAPAPAAAPTVNGGSRPEPRFS